MPGTRCAVYGCDNTYKKREESCKNLMFHRFPKAKDFVSQTIRKEWIGRCKRQDNFNPDTSYICSFHFSGNDCERDLKNELLGLPLRNLLKKTAVPTLALCNRKSSETNTSTSTTRSERLMKRKNKQEVDKLLKGATPPLSSDVLFTQAPFQGHFFGDKDHTNQEPSEEAIPKPLSPEPNCQPEIPDYETMYAALLDEHKDLKNKYNLLKRKNVMKSKQMKNLNDQLRYFKNKFYRSPTTQKSEAAHVLLRTVLTQNQIDLLSKKKKRVNWTREEIAVAFTLRYYSKKCYLFLRNKLHYPLPALSSLRKWASLINLGQGILTDVLLMLKLAGESFSDFERTVVLQYDEVKVKKIEEYNIAQDEVLGPYNYMQVVMARGLFANWKQPVYMTFDQKMTKPILHDIITELHKINFNVVACVSDCGASNVGLWKELGVNVTNTYFKHPVSGNNLYMFADAPHMLKLLRNWLLDKGFRLEDNVIVNKMPLQELVTLTNSEVNPCWKINQRHIDVERTQRQNVRLAAELLSNSVSTGLLHYKPGQDKQMAENLGHYIADINAWFDIFSSYIPRGNVPTKNAYGIDFENQNAKLNKVYQLVSSMRVIGKNTLMTFQKGILMSITSLQLLYEDMRRKMDITYICTHKLNQDSLENFFFQIRSRGGPDEHPSPLSTIYRVRMILLGKNPGILGSSVNTEEKVIEEYISPKVLETAKISNEAMSISDLNETQSSSSFSSVSSNSVQISSDFNENSQETTDDALEYIAGYLAKKHKNTLPSLGDFTYKITQDHSYNIPSWVQQLSYGGLIKPSRDFFKKIKTWNSYFQSHHGESFRKGPGAVHNLAKKIFKKEPNYPFKLIKDFCKLRTIIRINFRNLQAKYESSLKRKTSEDGDTRKRSRKMLKITK